MYTPSLFISLGSFFLFFFLLRRTTKHRALCLCVCMHVHVLDFCLFFCVRRCVQFFIILYDSVSSFSHISKSFFYVCNYFVLRYVSLNMLLFSSSTCSFKFLLEVVCVCIAFLFTQLLMRKRERIVRSFRLSSYYFFCCAVFFSSLFVVDMCVLCCGCRRFYTLTYYFIVVVVVVAVILISQRRAVKNFHFEFVFNFSISTPIDELRWATHGYRPPPSSSGTSNIDVSGVGFFLDFSTFWYRLCFGRVLFGVYCICAVVSIHPVGICARKVTLLRISENTQKKLMKFRAVNDCDFVCRLKRSQSVKVISRIVWVYFCVRELKCR